MSKTMNTFERITIAALALVLALTTAARAQAPDFDAAAWKPLDCGVGDPAGDETPGAVDLVGDAGHLSAFYAYDASFVYFRYRVNADPSGSGGFASYAWTALMQVPSGDPFQYQYELSLNGKSNTVEVWANTHAEDIDFSPLFNDPAEVQLFSLAAVTLPLARHVVASDGSSFGGNPDYFVDFAVPVSALVAKGVIATASDLDAVLFFPATSTNPNNYNKGYLACPFSPGATLAIDKSVSPTVVPAGGVTPVTYTIAVQNAGVALARGVVIDDPSLPAYFGTPTVGVSADDASVTWTIVSTHPLEVRVPNLPAGKTVTVTLSATASPTCGDPTYVNVATAFATNAPSVQDDATLTVNLAPAGCAACTSDADCNDSNACTTDACVAGACTSTADPSCTPCIADADCKDDGNPCTTEACNAGVCASVADPTCTPCGTDADCDDHDACTADACSNGVCTATAVPSCTPCVADADCPDDGDACTTEVCSAGACAEIVNPSCGQPCTTDADCDDHDACTTDACSNGTCTATPIPGCTSNPPVEDCQNGIDDDGDGLIDCHDPDCADKPYCAGIEVCGDCIDNDGDGLTDYDDPDCCSSPENLDVKRMMLSPAPKNPNAKQLNLKVRDTGLDPHALNPMAADTTIQISDPNGMILCQHIPATAWQHRNSRSFTFKDKTAKIAGGIKHARFRMKHNGAVPFRAVGKQVALAPTTGHDVMVTVGVGGQCSRTMAQFRAKGTRLLLP
jgi:uncharacterized repeat protein (TIGR01451 family)